MPAHLIDGKFQSDKYPTCPRGKVPLSVEDVTAQDLLWEYAQRRRAVDAEFADDLEEALRIAGYAPPSPVARPARRDDQVCGWQACENAAIALRDTPWGDLMVCATHMLTPFR